MAKVSADKFVRKGLVAGTFDFECPGVLEDACGDVPSGGEPFSTRGWPTREIAAERGDQHFKAHLFGLGKPGGKAMPELGEFRLKHKLVPQPDGTAISVKEL